MNNSKFEKDKKMEDNIIKYIKNLIWIKKETKETDHNAIKDTKKSF